jgi:hypothetical protein
MTLLDKVIESGPALVKSNGKPALEEIPEAGLVAAGRLTTAQLLVTFQQLGTSLHNANEAFSKLAESTPDLLPALLEQIINQTKGAQSKAARLLFANR